MMTRAEYGRWWLKNTGGGSELLAVAMDEPTATLAAHVMALQARIDNLPDPDDMAQAANTWTTRCACAYDDPRAVCMSHEARLARRAAAEGLSGGSETYEEWRVTGDPGKGHPPYTFTWSRRRDDRDPEGGARGFIALVAQSTHEAWVDGPHLDRRAVTETPWERVAE